MRGILCPGLPHLLHPEKSSAWKRLHDGFVTLKKSVEEYEPDAVVICSSQWMSVLGVSFLAVPRPQGVHVDENWYEYGDLEFDFPVDTQLSQRLAASVGENGIPTKLVTVAGFPIDTGTLVALPFVNPKVVPVVGISSWVYADPAKCQELGRLVGKEVRKTSRRPLFVAVSAVGARYATEEINPEADQLSPNDAQFLSGFTQRVLARDPAGASQYLAEQSRQVPLDMQGNAIHWLLGVMGSGLQSAEVLAQGPVWGTANAVIDFTALAGGTT